MANPECPRCHEPVLPAHVKDFVEREGGVECWHSRCRYEHQQEAQVNRVSALETALRESELLLTALAMAPLDQRGLVCGDAKLSAVLKSARSALAGHH